MPINIRRAVSWLVVTPIIFIIGFVLGKFIDSSRIVAILPSGIVFGVMILSLFISVFYSIKSLSAKESKLGFLVLLAALIPALLLLGLLGIGLSA